MRIAVTFVPARLLLASPLLLIAACHSQSDQTSITNSVIDNTVGTASDEMTNIDATTGSAANMAADVPAGTNAGGGSTDNSPTGADAGSGDAAQHDATPAAKPTHHPKAAPAKPDAPKLDSNPGTE